MRCRRQIRGRLGRLVLRIGSLAREVEPGAVFRPPDHLVACRVVGEGRELVRSLRNLEVGHVAAAVCPRWLVEFAAIAMDEDEPWPLLRADVAQAVLVPERFGAVEALVAALEPERLHLRAHLGELGDECVHARLEHTRDVEEDVRIDERHARELRRRVRERDARGERCRRLERRVEAGRAADREEARRQSDRNGRDLASLLLALFGREPLDEFLDKTVHGGEPGLRARAIDCRVELDRDEVAAGLRVLVQHLTVVPARQDSLRLRHRLPPIPRRRLVAPALRVAVGEAVVEILDPDLAAAEIADDLSRTPDRLGLRACHYARALVALLHDLPAALGARLDITVAVVALPVCHTTLRQFDHVIAS